MTRVRVIEEGAGLLVGLVFLVVWWQPRLAWVLVAAAVVGGAALVAAQGMATPADRVRQRRGAWMIPLATIVLAAQIVFIASPETRPRSLLVAGALVTAGLVVAGARRRAA